MISQHIFEHGFSIATAEALKVWGDANLITPLDPTNPYLEPVDIPDYNAVDTSHVLITTSNGNWSKINLSQYQHFYVEVGGDYGTTVHEITSSGADTNNRRTIALYDPADPTNDVHPGKLPFAKLAHFKLFFNGADYWTVDRISYSIRSVSDVVSFYNSSFNVINRMYTDDIGRTAKIRNYSHSNTVQNSRLNSQNRNSRLSDMVGLEINDWGTDGDVYNMYNNKFINNEIRNHNDGIQLVRGQPYFVCDYSGTIISGNKIWIEDNIYTDGNGILDPNGIYSESEDGIDLKVGGTVENPVIIENNYLWGFRRSDGTYGNISSFGDCIGMHFGVENVIIEDNVCFDSAEGISSQNNEDHTWSLLNGVVNNNIFFECGGFANGWVPSTPLCMADYNNNITMEYNTIVDCRREMLYLSTTYNSTFRYNTIINQETPGIAGTPLDVITTPNDIYTTAEGIAAGYDTDLVFTTDVFTNSPREITLTNVLLST